MACSCEEQYVDASFIQQLFDVYLKRAEKARRVHSNGYVPLHTEHRCTIISYRGVRNHVNMYSCATPLHRRLMSNRAWVHKPIFWHASGAQWSGPVVAASSKFCTATEGPANRSLTSNAWRLSRHSCHSQQPPVVCPAAVARCSTLGRCMPRHPCH